jgi:hypothetical protein
VDEARRRRWGSLSLGLGVVGLVLTVVGAVALATEGDDDTSAAQATASSAASSTTTAGPTTTVAPTTSTTEPLDAQVEAFFAVWTTELAAGDADALYARLHPLVVERYGEAACRAYLGSLSAPAAESEVLSVDPQLATWAWATDGQSTDVADAITVRLRRTEDGDTFVENDVHLASVDGEIRWFTDCGTPGG